MSNRNYGLFNTWDLAAVKMPPRTIFYNLSPIAMGTGEVESFSSYISRLALEHSLSSFDLLREVAGKNSPIPDILTGGKIYTTTGKLDGSGDTTEVLVALIEKAVHRKDICFTTLLAWKSISPIKLETRKRAACCALCYEVMRKKNHIIFNKLVWSVKVIKFCGIHKLPLTNVCPHCYNQFKPLTAQTHPGYCSKCYLWLGNDETPELKGWDNDEKEFEIWKYNSMVADIWEFPRLPPWSSRTIIRNLEKLIKIHADGNINDFAYRVNVWHLDIRRLLRNEFIPSIKTIYSISYALGVSPIEFFRDQIEHSFVTYSIPLRNEKSSLISKIPISFEDLQTLLSEYMLENPPPSASESARRIGWRLRKLERKFPAEYRKLVERYTTYIKQKNSPLSDEKIKTILKKATKENPPPSLQSIFRKIGCRNTGFRYYSRFPALCKEIGGRFKEAKFKPFDFQKATVIAEESLTENPAPSFSEIARRVGCKRDTLNKRLPALSKLTRDRYNNFIRERREAKKKSYIDMKEQLN